MTDPIDAIAEKLIEAAYEFYGRPPEAGGEYIHLHVIFKDFCFFCLPVSSIIHSY